MPRVTISQKKDSSRASTKAKTYKLAELFCGPGGIGCAAKLAKYKGYSIDLVWANDIDQDSCKTYGKNIHHDLSPQELDQAVLCQDVRELDFSSGLNGFNALAFGFPCNDFSIVGEKKGFKGEFGPLYTFGVKALEAGNPDWFVAENVGGLIGADKGQAFRKILKDLGGAGKEGYVLSPHLYKFEQYGVPQTRHRVIIVGIRKDLGLKFLPPTPTHDGKKKRFVNAKDAIAGQGVLPNSEIAKTSKAVTERLKLIPPGKNAWWLDELLRELPDASKSDIDHWLPNLKRDFNISTKNLVEAKKELTEKIEEVKLNVKSARMSQIYKRLDPNKPAYTITGSGGGGTHVYHWEEARALTNREKARLQGFPDDFEFIGSTQSVRKQIGMAVPVGGARIILESILKTMAGAKYDCLEGASLESYMENNG